MDETQGLHRVLMKYVKGETEDVSSVLDTMHALELQSMSYTVLKETKVGQTMSRLRKDTNATIATLAKQLLKKWKMIAQSPRVADLVKIKTQPKNVLPNLPDLRLKVIQKFIDILVVFKMGDPQEIAIEV